MHQISYSICHRYTRTNHGITIRVSLGRGGFIEPAEAKVDTGAEYCLFSREIGEALHIDIESGLPKTFGTLTGTLEAFGHEVTLQSFHLCFQSFVYFAKEKGLPRNLLGSIGWLRNLKLGLVDHDEFLYLDHYDS
ncbi:MAG: hypothetical protein L0229_20760 [Blastocatellia bacterium]|nr:hypothetical protein [Blastocatellia bacterium]